jgi:hypothetical protein
MLKLNGKPFDPKPAPKSVDAVKDFLDRQPQDELFSVTEMMARVGIGKDPMVRAVALLKDYTRLLRQRRYWGNPSAIAELDRRMNEAG